MLQSNAFDYINILDKAADASWLRNEAIANNIANADTPGYKRKDVQFEAYLTSAIAGGDNLDQDIQNLVDGIVNDPQYYPEQSTVALSYKLTLLDPDGETNLNYDTNTLLTYYRTFNGDSKYNNIYSDEAEARAAANAYKEAMLDKTAVPLWQKSLVQRFSLRLPLL